MSFDSWQLQFHFDTIEQFDSVFEILQQVEDKISLYAFLVWFSVLHLKSKESFTSKWNFYRNIDVQERQNKYGITKMHANDNKSHKRLRDFAVKTSRQEVLG